MAVDGEQRKESLVEAPTPDDAGPGLGGWRRAVVASTLGVALGFVLRWATRPGDR